MEFKTGKYDNISNKDYHKKIKAYSKTGLDLINRSYMHFLYSEHKESPALVFGAAYHCAILTPDLYEKEYITEPTDINRRTKAGKEEYQVFIEENSDKTVISQNFADSIKAMQDKVFAHPKAFALLKNGEAEQTYLWKDAKTGLQCKARPDYARIDGIVIDLKTTTDASWFQFQRSIASFRYHVQGAFYMDGIHATTKQLQEHFIIIAQEKEPPHEIAIYRIDEDSLKVGRFEYEKNLQTAKEYIEDKNAPCGYPQDIQDIFLPSWYD